MTIHKDRHQFILELEKLLEKHKKHLPIQDLAYDLLVTGGLIVFYNAPSMDNAKEFIQMCLEHVGTGYNKLKERDGKDK